MPVSHASLRAAPPGEVLAEHKGTSIELKRGDVLCMAPREWLNDEVINLYMGLLQERDARRRDQVGG